MALESHYPGSGAVARFEENADVVEPRENKKKAIGFRSFDHALQYVVALHSGELRKTTQDRAIDDTSIVTTNAVFGPGDDARFDVLCSPPLPPYFFNDGGRALLQVAMDKVL